MISHQVMMEHKQLTFTHSIHALIKDKIEELSKSVAATFAASRETNFDIAGNIEITFA